MINLGRVLSTIFIVSTTIYAGVVARVEPNIVTKGDTATYILSVSGSDFKKPILDSICGNDIVSTSSQTSIQSINGNYQKSYTMSYQFVPTKSCKIEPVALEIDANVEHSNATKIEVKPMKQDLNAEFTLSLEASKHELYQGEPFELTLVLKQHRNAKAVDSKFIAPDFKGFWIKEEGKTQRGNSGQHIITKIVYKLAPQREGSLTIKPAQLKIASRIGVNNWGTLIPQVKWKTYYSNELSLNVKPLPNNLKIIGDFTINAKVQRDKINPNEAVNLTLEIVGKGNLEDIKSFKPYISGVNVFDEKTVVKGDRLTQKLAFVSDSNFTIPPFTLEYFSSRTSKTEKILTEAINIEVSGNTKESKVEIKRDEKTAVVEKSPSEQKTVVTIDKLSIAIASVIAFMLGALSLYIFQRVKFSSKTKVVDLKNEKVLLMKLLPFKYDAQVQEIVDILESNIYSKEKIKLDKKYLKEIIKRYEIS